MSDAWKVGKKEISGIAKSHETCILVAAITEKDTETEVMEHLDELEFLATTAGAITAKVYTQRIKHPNVKSYVGPGKLDEIKEYIQANEDVTVVIIDADLTGKQNSYLEEYLKVKIVDRSTLILDIFAERAQTAQAKTQVELAQMQYLLPRLRGLWTHLERQRGGIGMRGPGEMEIETDRRIVRDKIALLKKRLEKIDQQAQTQRKNRGELIRVSLVGYTNAGKSTLMNALSKSDVFAEDKLFATLDTTVRKVVWDNMPFLLSDTVGFIRKLPHHLVESFKSTLDEVRESDILVHVVDVSHPQYEDHINTVMKTLEELGAHGKSTLLVFNKIDAFRSKYFDDLLSDEGKEEILDGIAIKYSGLNNMDSIFISAVERENFEALRQTLMQMISEAYQVRYPYQSKSW